MTRFEGRTVLVTGAASGIGLATCQRLTAEGAAVVMVDRDAEELDRAVGRVQGPSAPFAADVTDEAALSAAIEDGARRLGGLDGVFPCAGVFASFDTQPITDISKEQFLGLVEVHLGGTFLTVKHALPRLLDRGGGAIVTMGSRAALRSAGSAPAYTAAKGGIVSLTRLLAAQYGSRGVRVNCICPGLVDTPLTAPVMDAVNSGARSRATDTPLGPAGTPADIASVVAFLLSDDAVRMTGATVVVDGGLSIV